MNFLGNSFGNIKRDISNGYGVFESAFTLGIKPEEINSIKQFNYQVESGVPIGQAWTNTMSGCRTVVKQAAVDIRSGAVSFDALQKSANASKTGIMGATVAATAMNMAISMGLSLAIQALVTGLQALADMLPTVDNTAKWLEESSQEVQDVQGRIEELNTELKTTQERILELEGKDSLTIIEQNELDRLRQTNAELEREIELEERKLKVSQSKNAKNFVEAVKTKQNQSTSQYGNNYGDTETRASRDINGNWRNGDKWHTKSDGDANQKETFELRLKDYKDAEKKYQKALEDGNSDEAQKWKDRMQTIDNAMSGYTSDLQGYLDDLGEYDYSTLSDEAKSTVDYIQDAQNKYMMATGSNGESVFSSIFNSGRFEQGRKAIQSLGETGQITADSLSDLYESNQYVKDMIDNMVEVGLLADTSHESFDGLVGDIARLNSGLNAISETASKSKQDLKTFFTTLNEDKDKKKSKNLADEIKSGELGKYIEKLTDEEAQVAYYFVQKAEDTSKLDLSFVKKTVEGYRKAKTEYDDLVADAAKNGTGNSEAIQNAYDNLIKYIGAIETIDISAETEAIGKFNTAISESVSETGLSSDSISALKDRFKDLDGYDPSTLFERTTGGVHLNQEALEGLENQFENTQKIMLDNKLEKLTSEYNELTAQIDTCRDSTGKAIDASRLAELQSEASTKLTEIQNTQILQAQYEALTSSYYKWQKAKSSGDERDKYSNMGDSYSGIKDLINQGWYDDKEVTKYLDLMINADNRTKDNIKDFDTLTQKIKGTDYSIMDFFQYDDDNKLTSEGLFNFLDAVKSKLGEKYVEIDKEGNYTFDFTGKKVEKVAEKLGMSTEAVQIFEQALSDAGFNVIFDDINKNIQAAKDHAAESIDKLKELKKEGKIETELTVDDGQGHAERRKIDLDDFDMDSTDIDEIKTQITDAQALLTQFTNKDGKVNVKLQGAKEVQDVLLTLITRKQELEAPAIMDIDIEKIKKKDPEIANAVRLLQNFTKFSNEIEAGQAKGLDTSKTEGKLKKVATKISKLKPEIKAKLKIDDKNDKNFGKNIKKISVGAKVKKSDIDAVKKSISDINPKKIKIKGESKGLKEDLKSIQEYKLDDKKFKIEMSGADDAYNRLTLINGQLSKLKNGSITITTTTQSKGGKAKAFGSSFARGSIGTKTGGTGLVGELGREILVDGYSGSWRTVGDNGAEFVKYRKGSIFFNHKQTEELLKNGKTSRGKAFASGNAFAVNDGAKGSGGKRSGKNTHSASQDDSGSKKSGGSGSGGSGSGNNNNNNTKKTPLERFQNWTSKLFDWIEVRLSRVKRKIDNAVKSAETNAENGKFSKSAAQYRKAIKETQKLIDNNTSGAKRYKQQANAVLKKATTGDTKIIDRKKANKLVKKIKNGTIDISKYGEKTQEFIKEYQSFYEKSLDCKDALADLNKNMSEYYEKLYNLPIDEATRKIDKLSASLNVLQKKADAVSGGSNVYTREAVKNRKSDLTAAQSANKIAKNKVKSSGNSLLNSLSGKAKKKLKGKVKKGKKVSLKGLKGEALKRAKAYNAAIDNQKITQKEEKDANTAYQKALNLQKKYKGQPSYMYENALLGEETKNAKDQYKANQVAARKASKNLTAAEKRKAKADAAVKKAKKKGKKSKAYKQAIKEQKAANKALKAAREANKTATQNAAIAEAEYTKTLQENTKAMGDNILKYHESIRSINSAKKGLYEAQNSLNETKGIRTKQSDYDSLISNAKTDITNAKNAYNDYNKWYTENKKNLSEEDKKAAKAELLNLQTSTKEAKKIYQEFINAKGQVPFNDLEHGIELLDALKNRYAAFVSYMNAIGRDESSYYYLQQITTSQQQAAKALDEYRLALKNAAKAHQSADGVYEGKSAEDWGKEANQYMANYYKYLEEAKEMKTTLAHYLEEPFEKAIKKIEHFEDVLNGLSDLINDDMFFDDDGKLTQYGTSQISLLVEGYEAGKDKLAEYSAELEQVNENYAKGYYSAEEYQERTEELNKSMLDGAKAVKSSLDEIIKMYKDMAQTELDSVKELIDQRSEALQKKKDYYEWGKNLKGKNKEIEQLQAEIAALEGVAGAAAKSKRAQLMSDLAEKQEDLDDTLKDHYFELSKDSLDEMKDTLQEAFDKTWKEISLDIAKQVEIYTTAQSLATSSVDNVNSNLVDLLKFYGITPSNANAIAKNASGTRSVPRNMYSWVNERGQELITSNKGTITPLAKGDGVIPADLTDRLIALATGGISSISGKNAIPDMELKNVGNVTQHYDSLIKIEGSADAATVEDLKKFSKDFLQKSYEYTSNQIYKNTRKTGGKRQV